MKVGATKFTFAVPMIPKKPHARNIRTTPRPQNSLPCLQESSKKTHCQLQVPPIPHKTFSITMRFSESTEKITITKGVLSALCKKADNKTSVQSSISLNDYIGNVDGELTWGGRGFSHVAENVHITNGLLVAKLKNQAGKLVESTLDLNQHIQNTDGVLEVIPLDV
ncbi:Cyanovirin-N [Gymnopilus junonius]|uniref:Cyanovirin-N n=1 Tax=Gymnopilus junonius TaxID=109634 RepID=A0A9P5TPL4_GYMJU|nr:Cyanovirin-N [Gymnopilus junonius]